MNTGNRLHRSFPYRVSQWILCLSSLLDYEEDFEADDEGPLEDAEAKEKKSPSPSTETEKQVQERDASETEDDEKDGGWISLFEHIFQAWVKVRWHFIRHNLFIWPLLLIT